MKEPYLGPHYNLEKSFIISKLCHVTSNLKGGRQGGKVVKNKNNFQHALSKNIFYISYISYSSLYLHQSQDGRKFVPYDPSTLNDLLFSVTHIAHSSVYVFEHITLILQSMSYISPPSNSLLILALLTQGSLFLSTSTQEDTPTSFPRLPYL